MIFYLCVSKSKYASHSKWYHQMLQNDVIKCCKMMSSNVVLLHSNNCCVVLEPAICEDLDHVAIFIFAFVMFQLLFGIFVCSRCFVFSNISFMLLNIWIKTVVAIAQLRSASAFILVTLHYFSCYHPCSQLNNTMRTYHIISHHNKWSILFLKCWMLKQSVFNHVLLSFQPYLFHWQGAFNHILLTGWWLPVIP